MAGNASEPGSEAGTATTGNPGGGPGTGGPPASTPAGGAPLPSPGPAGLPLDALPEEFRGLPESQIRFLLNKTFEAVRTQGETIRQLQAQKQNAPGTSTVSLDDPSKAPTPAAPPKPLEEWMLEDPKAAMKYFIETEYGDVINGVKSLGNRVGQTEFDAVRREVDDFGEYEEDIRQILTDSRAPLSRENVLGAYTLAVGKKVLEEKQRGKRAALNSDVPTSEPATPVKVYAGKTTLSEEIRIGSGLSEEEFYETHDVRNTPLQVKLPGVKA